MLRTFIAFALMTIMASATVSSQSQLPLRPDTTIKAEIGTAAAGDSSIIGLHDGASRRPMPLAPVRLPKRSGICGSITRPECALYGALIVGGLGMVVGQATSPQPEMQRSGLGDLFGDGYCSANCGVPHEAVIFALVGSAVGGLGGWLIGRH